MLAETLKKNIPQLLKARNFTYTQLEQKAGLHKNYISNFLAKDFTPGLDAAVKIANALNITVDELVGRPLSETTKNFTLPSDDTEFDSELLEGCIDIINELLEQKEKKINFNKFIYLVKEIYLYALCRNEKKIDAKFADWFIDRSLE